MAMNGKALIGIAAAAVMAAGGVLYAVTADNDGGDRTAAIGTTFDASTVKMQSLSAQGSGCTSQTVTASLTSDRKSLNLRYATGTPASTNPPGEMWASVRPGELTARANCSAAAVLTVPARWTFAITSVEHRVDMYTAHPTGGHWSARILALLRSAGQSVTDRTISSAERQGRFTDVVTIPASNLKWSPCSPTGGVPVAATVSMTASGDGASVKLYDQNFSLVWRAC